MFAWPRNLRTFLEQRSTKEQAPYKGLFSPCKGRYNFELPNAFVQCLRLWEPDGIPTSAESSPILPAATSVTLL